MKNNLVIVEIAEDLSNKKLHQNTLVQCAANVKKTFSQRELKKLLARVQKLTSSSIGLTTGLEEYPLCVSIAENRIEWSIGFYHDDESKFTIREFREIQKFLKSYFRGYEKSAVVKTVLAEF